MSLASVASIVGIGAGGLSIYNQLKGGGGSTSGGGYPPVYQPTGLANADQRWQNAQGMYNTALGSIPGQSTDLTNAESAYNAVPSTGYTSAANVAGNLYGGLSGTGQQYQNLLEGQAGKNAYAQQQLMTQGNQLGQYGANVMNLAMDPQQALYNQQYQQTVDQSRAGSSARGIGMSGEAAGLENQATNNFMNTWTNQQLGRATSALGATSGAYGQMGNLYGQAGQQGAQYGQNLQGSYAMGQAGANSALQSGQVPYNAALTAAQQPFQGANMYGQGMQQNVYSPLGQATGMYSPYLNYGQGAQGQAYGQGQTNLNNLTTGLGQLGNTLSGMPNWNYGVNPTSGNINYGSYTGSGDEGGWPGDSSYGN